MTEARLIQKITVETPSKFTPEILFINGTEYVNYSFFPLAQVIHRFPHKLQAKKIILMPDFSPSRSPLPTGSMVELRKADNPEWQKYAVSDVGCGMVVARSTVSFDEFTAETDGPNNRWMKIADTLEKKGRGVLGNLGSGNHFLDAVVEVSSTESLVSFVLHSGSGSDAEVAARLAQAETNEFEEIYGQLTGRAIENRQAILEVLEKNYGKLTVISDTIHNTYVEDGDTVLIYKGSVRLSPNVTTVIPSSMNGDMVLVEGRGNTSDIHYTVPHGTGRHISRSDLKAQLNARDTDSLFKTLRREIYIPPNITNQQIQDEMPQGYRNLEECLERIEELVFIKERLTPIAYIGQV